MPSTDKGQLLGFDDSGRGEKGLGQSGDEASHRSGKGLEKMHTEKETMEKENGGDVL